MGATTSTGLVDMVPRKTHEQTLKQLKVAEHRCIQLQNRLVAEEELKLYALLGAGVLFVGVGLAGGRILHLNKQVAAFSRHTAQSADAQAHRRLNEHKHFQEEVANIQQRARNEIEKAQRFGSAAFVRDLLEVPDNLDRALKTVDTASLSSLHYKSLHEGLVMTQKNIGTIFKKHGIVAVNPVNQEQFDPNFHEAVTRIDADSAVKAAPGSVVEVLQVGYRLHERVVRPARVSVMEDPVRTEEPAAVAAEVVSETTTAAAEQTEEAKTEAMGGETNAATATRV